MINNRLSPLEKLLGKGADAAELDVEVAITADGEKHGTACRAEGNLSVNGKFYRAEASAATMEAAVEGMHRELEQELRSGRGRARRLLRRGSATLKSMLRFGQ